MKTRTRLQRGMSLLDVLILLILLGGLIGLLFINDRIKQQAAAQADGLGTQSREMAVIARAAFSYFLTTGNTPTAGQNIVLEPNTLVTQAYLPTAFAYRPGTSVPTSPAGQPYKVIGRSGTAGGLEILVFATGPMQKGMLTRVGAEDTTQGRQDYGLKVIRQLTDEYHLTAGWVKSGTRTLDASATGVTKDLAVFMTDNMANDTVMIYSGTSAEAAVVTPADKPASTCRIARGTSTCGTGETAIATFSACQGMSSTGTFTETTIATPMGNLFFQLGDPKLSPAAQSCGGTFNGYNPPSNCTGWAQGTITTQAMSGGGPASPYSNISGWMNSQRVVSTQYNGAEIMTEACTKQTITAGSGPGTAKSTITVGPTTAGAGTNALCCT